MFRVSFFCDDRKLAGALRVLVGVAVGAPEVAPVETGPHVDIPQAPRTGSRNQGSLLVPQFAEWLRINNPTELRLGDVKAWLTQIGRNPNNAQHVAKNAVRKGHLRRQGEGRDTKYLVVTEAPAVTGRKRRGRRVK